MTALSDRMIAEIITELHELLAMAPIHRVQRMGAMLDSKRSGNVAGRLTAVRALAAVEVKDALQPTTVELESLFEMRAAPAHALIAKGRDVLNRLRSHAE